MGHLYHGYVTNNQMVIPYIPMIFPYKTIYSTFPYIPMVFPYPLIWPLDFQHHNLSRLHHAMAHGLRTHGPGRARAVRAVQGTAPRGEWEFYPRKREGKRDFPQFSQQFSRISCKIVPPILNSEIIGSVFNFLGCFVEIFAGESAAHVLNLNLYSEIHQLPFLVRHFDGSKSKLKWTFSYEHQLWWVFMG